MLIVLSPGTSKHVTLSELKPDSANRQQHFVCTCGAGELPGNVQITRLDADFARRAGSKVELKLYPGVSAHAFPADFLDVFPTWLKFIRGDDMHCLPKMRRPGAGPCPGGRTKGNELIFTGSRFESTALHHVRPQGPRRTVRQIEPAPMIPNTSDPPATM